jgi:hypothetical protein
MRWTSPAGHVLRTLPERPFMPVRVGEGVSPPVARAEPVIDDPPIPPDPLASFEDEWQSLLEQFEPVPF